jgi:hypothetical protein
VQIAVFLDGWQIECCAEPPSPGDRVQWPSTWVDDPSGPGNLRLDWRPEPLASGVRNEPGDRLLRHGSVAAYWRGPAPVPAHGALVADVHGGVPEAVPPITGTVVSVDVVDQAYRLSAPRTYLPISGDFRLRRVDRSPKWFSSGATGEDDLPDPMRDDSGVLVRLSVEAAILDP